VSRFCPGWTLTRWALRSAPSPAAQPKGLAKLGTACRALKYRDGRRRRRRIDLGPGQVSLPLIEVPRLLSDIVTASGSLAAH
jgi:hypothetical protein